jgi:hypothetical protein
MIMMNRKKEAVPVLIYSPLVGNSSDSNRGFSAAGVMVDGIFGF